VKRFDLRAGGLAGAAPVEPWQARRALQLVHVGAIAVHAEGVAVREAVGGERLIGDQDRFV
jgi:hypothetical protein